MEIITNEEEALKYLNEKVKEYNDLCEANYWEQGCSLLIKEEMDKLSEELEKLEKISPELKRNKKFVLQAMKTGFFNLRKVDKNLLNDKEICLTALKYNKNNTSIFEFEYINDEFRNDESFMLEAIKINPKLIVYVGDKLKTNQDFLDKAIINIYLKIDYTRKEQEEKMKKNCGIDEEDEFECSGMGRAFPGQ